MSSSSFLTSSGSTFFVGVSVRLYLPAVTAAGRGNQFVGMRQLWVGVRREEHGNSCTAM